MRHHSSNASLSWAPLQSPCAVKPLGSCPVWIALSGFMGSSLASDIVLDRFSRWALLIGVQRFPRRRRMSAYGLGTGIQGE